MLVMLGNVSYIIRTTSTPFPQFCCNDDVGLDSSVTTELQNKQAISNIGVLHNSRCYFIVFHINTFTKIKPLQNHCLYHNWNHQQVLHIPATENEQRQKYVFTKNSTRAFGQQILRRKYVMIIWQEKRLFGKVNVTLKYITQLYKPISRLYASLLSSSISIQYYRKIWR